jgi:hypothetical protein
VFGPETPGSRHADAPPGAMDAMVAMSWAVLRSACGCLSQQRRRSTELASGLVSTILLPALFSSDHVSISARGRDGTQAAYGLEPALHAPKGPVDWAFARLIEWVSG